MITPAQRAEIRRLYFGEHWKVGTIAAARGIHHETVRAALQHETGGLRRGVSRSSALDPFLPFIRDTLTPYPRLRATRLHEMLRLRGYPAGRPYKSADWCGACGPRRPRTSIAAWSPWWASKHRSTGVRLARSASATACARSPAS